MAYSTPIPRGAVIELRNTDDNDPETPIEAFMVHGQEDVQECLGGSFGAESLGHFTQLITIFCSFHQLPAPVNLTRYTEEELFA